MPKFTGVLMKYGAPAPRRDDPLVPIIRERVAQQRAARNLLGMEEEMDIDGKRIIEERKKLCWTQTRLASALGVSKPYMSDVERGRRGITKDRAEQLAAIFGIEPAELAVKCSACGQPVLFDKEPSGD